MLTIGEAGCNSLIDRTIRLKWAKLVLELTPASSARARNTT